MHPLVQTAVNQLPPSESKKRSFCLTRISLAELNKASGTISHWNPVVVQQLRIYLIQLYFLPINIY